MAGTRRSPALRFVFDAPGGQEAPSSTVALGARLGGLLGITRHGGWRTSPQDYARAIARLKGSVGKLDWAAPQDWTCDPKSIARTGLSVDEHQRRTIQSYLQLRKLGAPVIPVLQGWTWGDYMRHDEAYLKAGVNLSKLPVVGLGSIAGRGGSLAVANIVASLSAEGIRLHGFGVKRIGLQRFGAQLASADSTAWGTEARYQGAPGDRNSLDYALGWRGRILSLLEREGIPVEMDTPHHRRSRSRRNEGRLS